MLSRWILRGSLSLAVSPAAGFSFASKFCEKPRLIVCWGSERALSVRPVGSMARANASGTFTPGAYCQLICGEIECRIRENGPRPGKNAKNVGEMLAKN